jgi:hypothetical protein
MEPKHRDNLGGKYRLEHNGVLVNSVSFDTKEDAAEWGDWNNFGNGNPYQIVEV